MLPLPGPSAETTEARKRRGGEGFDVARQNVLTRHGLTEGDLNAMSEDEKIESGIGAEMLFELVHSDWAKQRTALEHELQAGEDERDVSARREAVLDEVAELALPYPRKAITALLRRERRDIETYSSNIYAREMFAQPGGAVWKPVIDVSGVADAMTRELIHPEAFRLVSESVRLTALERHKAHARLFLQLPSFALMAGAVVGALFALSIVVDLMHAFLRTPTIRAGRRGLAGLGAWLSTDNGVLTCVAAIALAAIFIGLRRKIQRFVDSD